MKSLVSGTLITLTLAAVWAAPLGVRPVADSRITRDLPGTNDIGSVYLLGRELKVDLTFSSGKNGKGLLFIAFEPSTGLFFQGLRWEANDYPRVSLINELPSQGRFLVTKDRLLLISVASNGVMLHETTEKASTLEDAEARSLAWIDSHLADIDTGKSSGPVRSTYLRMSPAMFPKGFFPEGDVRAAFSLNITDIARKDKGWEITVEAVDTDMKGRLFLGDKGPHPAGEGPWGLSPVYPVPKTAREK